MSETTAQRAEREREERIAETMRQLRAQTEKLKEQNR